MARPRLTHRPRDMILSLGVILVPIFLIAAFFTRPTETPVRPVDWRPVAAQARAEAPWQVLAPTGLTGDWVPTRATWQDGTWTSGWLTPNRTYVELSQQAGSGEGLVRTAVPGAISDGQRVLQDQTWQQYRTDDGRTRALVRRAADVTTVVAGDLSWDALAAFATTLAPVT